MLIFPQNSSVNLLRKIIFIVEIQVLVDINCCFSDSLINNLNTLMVKTKQLKSFGFIWSLIFAAIAIYPFLKGEEIKFWALLVSVSFIIISLLYPKLYEKTHFYQSWLRLGDFMGKINSKIIIFILFFAIFLPTGIVLKIFRKDLLAKKIDKSAQSYFINREKQPENMENQF